MHTAPDLTAIRQRDLFLKRVVETRRIYMVSGEDGLARVPSRRQKGREVTLMWSRREVAEQWADVIAANPRVKELQLGAVLGDILPALVTINRFAGVDWCADGAEPEYDAADIAERIRLEALDYFIHKAIQSGRVWTLEDVNGPALLVSAVKPNQFVMPCWVERSEAEARIEGPWRDMMAMDIPLPDFLDRRLVWLNDRGHLVAPGHTDGANALELEPPDVNARFAERLCGKPAS